MIFSIERPRTDFHESYERMNVFSQKYYAESHDDEASTCERKHFSVVSAIWLRAIYYNKFMCITLAEQSDSLYNEIIFEQF